MQPGPTSPPAVLRDSAAIRSAADIADDLCRPMGRVRIEVGVPDGEGWVPFPALADADEVEQAHNRVIEDHGVRPKTAAMWLASFVAATAVAPALRAHRLHGVLLDVPFTSLRVHRDPGRSYSVVAVPPDAVVRDAPPEERLAAIGRHAAEGMRPLVEALLERCRVGRRGIWGAVADGVTSEVLTLVMADFDRFEEILADVRDVFDAADPPFTVRPQWSVLPMGDRKVPVPARAVCCAAHNGAPGRCSTCPDRAPEERLARLMARGRMPDADDGVKPL